MLGKQLPIGARVTIHYQGHVAVRHIVTGDSTAPSTLSQSTLV